MITLAEYINNPCGTLSIPYWKAKNIVIPPDMKILHDNDFNTEIFSDYIDEKYFRLYHNLKEIPKVITNDFEITTATRKDIKSIVQIINDSYTDISVNKELILEWIQVLPRYRGKKIGQLTVTELLFRMIDVADFATVSGKVDNMTNPEALYRKCGFAGDDVWHILHKK